jgi:hypothetical protein
MGIRVEFPDRTGPVIATVDGRKWTCENKSLEGALNARVWTDLADHSLDPEWTLARRAAKEWHGNILDEPEPDIDEEPEQPDDE